MKKIKHILRAVWLFASIWDLCWWHDTLKRMESNKPYYIDCESAWKFAKMIWLD